MAKKLDSVAKESERSKSFLIQKALEYFLEEKADLQIALDRLHDSTDKVISMEEIKEELEI
ncbi:MAG: DNA-binding protein [Desulfuromonas sp. SDB]|nr:MAG: DNA-binding protein [Desulfuromonas sp. SDB]